MTTASPQTDASSDVFDRILGRKGDVARLEPATKAAAKNIVPELTKALEEADIEMEVEFTGHGEKTVEALFENVGGEGTVCTLLGTEERGPLVYVMCDNAAAGVLAEVMLGGNPDLVPVSVKRPPSAIEKDLIGSFGDIVGKALKAAVHTSDTPQYLRVATTMDEMRAGGGSQPVFGFDLDLQFGSAQARLTVALSHRFLLQMERRSDPVRRPAHSAGERRRNARAMTVNVPVTASIALDAMTLKELAALSKGAVIALPETDGANVRLKVSGRPLYDCALGRKGEHYALSLRRPHRALEQVLEGIASGATRKENENE